MKPLQLTTPPTNVCIVLLAGSSSDMHQWITAIDAAVQGASGKAKDRMKKVEQKYKHSNDSKKIKVSKKCDKRVLLQMGGTRVLTSMLC